MKKTRESLDRSRKDELKAIEERKHIMIDQLMAEHQKAFADIKNYYNDITHNNLDLIKSLKEEVKELEADERKDEMRLNEKMQENKKLSAPLKRMLEDVVRLRGEHEDYKTEKSDMRKVKGSLVTVEEDLSTVTWEYEVLTQRFEELKKERDDLQKQYMACVYDVKQKSSFKGLLLEKKLFALQRVQEEKEAQLSEVLGRANLESSALGLNRGGVGDVVTKKNAEVISLQSELARLHGLQEQLYRAIVAKMGEYGLSATELGFDPVLHNKQGVKGLAQTA